MKTPVYGREEISRIVNSIGFDRLMDEAISGIEAACVAFDSSIHSIPIRSGFSYDDEHSSGLLEWMPVIHYGHQVVVKLVAYHPHNPTRLKLPTVLSTVISFDTRSGHATSIVDGTFLTSLRTGAASAVASRVLAKPDAKTLGLIGAGAQSITQLHALSRIFDINRVLISDIDAVANISFNERAQCAGLNLPAKIASIDEILSSSDIVCTATSIEVDEGPLFDVAEMPGDIHFNAVGSDFPGKIELPKSLLGQCIVCPDFREQAIREGECQQLEPQQIGPELHELVKKREEFQTHRRRKTVFDSTGWALEDLVMANILTGLGNDIGCARMVELECVANDPKSPYGFLAETNETDLLESLPKALFA